MKQLIAIHEVIRDGENGKSEAIAPGKGFSASEELASLLLDLGAARLDDSVVAVQSAEESAEVDLMKLKKDDLVALAAERQVEIGENATKAEIVEALNAADAEDELV